METSMHYTSANHADQVMEQINELRQNRELCDIILRCNNHRIAAHKLVLSVNSPYFRSLMNNRYYNEPGLYEHRLPGLEGDAVKQIVEFFYTSAVSVDEESVWTLLPAASKLHVAEIQNLCTEFLLANLQIENCLNIHKLATECLSSNLLKESTDYIKDNFEKLLEEDSFLDLEFEDAMPHLKRLGDTGLTNGQLLQAIKCWIIAAVDERQIYGYKIIRQFTNLAQKLEEFIPSEFLEVDQDEIGRRITQERENIDSRALLTSNSGMDLSGLNSGRNHFMDSEKPLRVETSPSYTNKGGIPVQSKPDQSNASLEKNNNIHSNISNGDDSEAHMCSECAEEFDSKTELEEHVKTHKVLIKRENVSPTSSNQNGLSSGTQSSTHSGRSSVSPRSFSSPAPKIFGPSIMNANATASSKNPLLNRSNSPYEDFIKMNNLDASRNMSYLSGSLKNRFDDESSGSYFDNYMRARGLDSPSFGTRTSWSPLSATSRPVNSGVPGEDLNFTCPICGKNYLDKDSLNRHVATHSNFPCPVCEKTYSTKSNLQTHMKKHSDENIFSCSTCDKSFVSASVLKAHLRTHTGDKPFVCPTCGVAFAKNIHLRRHLSIHTGIKPHECHVCGKRFSRSDHLKRHIQSIHTQDRPHICSICNKDFVRKYELNKHMKQCHYGVAVIDDDSEMNSSHESYNNSFSDPPSQIVRSLLPRFPLLNNSSAESSKNSASESRSREVTPTKSDGPSETSRDATTPIDMSHPIIKVEPTD
ncbi:hypothetical protein FSP39_016644 [Pinctada imbricata]|uniref:Uncharacterized protein n=1 Tax=Pinctada imbricata TaxID=66713 RepID=A0AA88XMN5_PINIB|nr:hypothetical protein FSP39_016644 [Pinctada imbricata]